MYNTKRKPLLLRYMRRSKKRKKTKEKKKGERDERKKRVARKCERETQPYCILLCKQYRVQLLKLAFKEQSGGTQAGEKRPVSGNVGIPFSCFLVIVNSPSCLPYHHILFGGCHCYASDERRNRRCKP